MSKDSEGTELFGVRLGQKLRGSEVIELSSDLGGGKTTLTAGIVKGAGSSDVVASPTFMVQKRYGCPNFTIAHFDFYRLSDDETFIQQTLSEELEAGDVAVIEWASQIPGALPKRRVLIELRRDAEGENVRKIICHYPDDMHYLFEEMK